MVFENATVIDRVSVLFYIPRAPFRAVYCCKLILTEMSLSDARNKAVDRLKSGDLSNEAQVKQAVILPILRSQDWDDTDPNQFKPEYKVRKGFVDYALFSPTGPRVFIEAKRQGALDAKGEAQLFTYAANEGIPILILTDGDRWDFYLSMAGGAVSERCFLQIRLSESGKEDDSHICRVLRRDHVESGSARLYAEKLLQVRKNRDLGRQSIPEAWQALVQEPDGMLHDLVEDKVFELRGVKPNPDDVRAFLGALRDTQSSIGKIPKKKKLKRSVRKLRTRNIEPGSESWTSIADYGSPTHKPCPMAVRFWDGIDRPLKSWNEILVEVVSRLYADGILTKEHLPVAVPRSSRSYLISSSPKHADGRSFITFKQLGGLPIYVSTNLSAKQILRHSNWLLEQFDKDPRTDALLKESAS